jgi:prostamide/prostaglandin F2alpha synthase
MCRLYSRRLSTLKPALDANNVRHVGVGLEELGVQEFVDGKFFDGELYIDLKKKSYQDLGFKRLGFFSGISSILGKKGREFLAKAKNEGIAGDMKGDGFQNGGTLIIQPGGKVLLTFLQDSPSDHVATEDVLKALNITHNVPEEAKIDEAN